VAGNVLVLVDDDVIAELEQVRARRRVRRPESFESARVLLCPMITVTAMRDERRGIDVWHNVRYAARTLARSSSFTLTATLALGLAIGANGAIFGLVDALWFRPPGVRDSGTLVRVFGTTSTNREDPWSYPEYLAMQGTISAFESVVARGRRGAVLPAADGSPELVLVNVVSLNFFTALGVTAAQGRLFAPGDDALLEAQPGIVLGQAFWQRRFGGDPSIVGSTVRLGRGEPVGVTVLGVLPPTFRDLDAAADRHVWLPPQTWTRLTGPEEFQRRDSRWFDVIARLRDGASVEAAEAEVATLAVSLAQEFPAANTGRSARVLSDLDYRLESGGMNAAALLGIVLLVVLITCVNVANLLLAHGTARSQEMAVRVALGAGRFTLVRQLLTESALLGVLGASAGLIIAMWLIRVLPALMPAPPGLHSLLLFDTDARVVLFTLAVTLLTMVVVSLAPAWIASRADVLPLMKGESGMYRSRHAEGVLRHVLITGQIAISVTLLCTAAVLARSFVETHRADIGISRRPLLTIWATLDLPAGIGFEAVRQLEQLPGVAGVAVALRAPLSLSGGGAAGIDTGRSYRRGWRPAHSEIQRRQHEFLPGHRHRHRTRTSLHRRRTTRRRAGSDRQRAVCGSVPAGPGSDRNPDSSGRKRRHRASRRRRRAQRGDQSHRRTPRALPLCAVLAPRL
jgi:putative ABC transport system permease protein